jgi:MurNAc alpha-1-phosphate uridylyltransferase
MTAPQTPDRAFILAAGRGNRLRPHTDTLPKPMVPVAGKPIIDYVIDGATKAGVTDITVNLHYMADKLEAHLNAKAAPRFTLSHEQVLLDTGGGIKNGLASMGDGPFYILSGDSFWADGPSGDTLRCMAAAWDPEKMDLLLMLQPLTRLHTDHAVGDYDMQPDGRIVRSRTQNGAYMWTSIRICDRRLFEGTPDGAFSFLTLMDRAQERGRLYGMVHDGEWYHITTPDDLTQIDAALLRARTPVYA